MQKIKITVMKQTIYPDLIAQYENPISHACDMKVGQVFVANGWEKPDGCAKVPGTVCQSL